MIAKDTIRLSEEMINNIQQLDNNFKTTRSIEDKSIQAEMIINKSTETFSKRSGFSGASDRYTTPLSIYPVDKHFEVCHMIPYKYIGIENRSDILFGAPKKVNDAMREAERELDNLIQSGTDTYYSVKATVESKSLIVDIEVIPLNNFDEGYYHGYKFRIEDDSTYYVFDEEMMNKESIQTKSESDISSNEYSSALLDQWNNFKTSITLDDGREIKGVQVTPHTFVDIDMNKYPNKSNETIVNMIDGKNWIFSEYIFSVLGISGIKGYIENKEEYIVLNIIQDNNNHIFSIEQNIRNKSFAFDITDIIVNDLYSYKIYPTSHSKLYEKTWELQKGEFAELDEDTMTVYPAEKEDGTKLGISLKNKTSTLVTGTVGSGKTASMKTFLMPFIKSSYADVAIIDMKESNDFNFLKGHIESLFTEDGFNNGIYYLYQIKQYIKERNDILKSMDVNNFWNLPKEQRPFNLKLVVIDEIHKLLDDADRTRVSWRISHILSEIIKECRSVGIHIVLITQNANYCSINSDILKLINNQISFRGGDPSHESDDKLKNIHKTIPNNDKSVGVCVIQAGQGTHLSRFGYYDEAILKEMVKEIEPPKYQLNATNSESDDEWGVYEDFAEIINNKSIKVKYPKNNRTIGIDTKGIVKQRRIKHTTDFVGSNMRPKGTSRKRQGTSKDDTAVARKALERIDKNKKEGKKRT